MKKGQATIFLAIGIIVLILVGISIFFVSQKNSSELGIEQSQQFSSDTEVFNSYFDQCADNAIVKSNEQFGVAEGNEQVYVQFFNNQLQNCIDDYIAELKNRGYQIQEGSLSSELNIYEKTILIDIKYPVTITKASKTQTFSGYEFAFPRVTKQQINNGVVEKTSTMFSTDNKLSLSVEEGTKVTLEDGSPVEDISISVEDVHFEGLPNTAVIGNLVYEGLPDGAHFDPPIEVSIKLSPSDIQGRNPYTFKLATYDEERDLWLGYPSQYIPETNTVKGLVDHFSYLSIASCTPGVTAVINIPVDTFYQDPFIFEDNPEWCDEEEAMDKYWADNVGWDGKHIHPEFMVSPENIDQFCREKPEYYNDDANGYDDTENIYSPNIEDLPETIPNVYSMNSYYKGVVARGPVNQETYEDKKLCDPYFKTGQDSLKDWNKDDKIDDSSGISLFTFLNTDGGTIDNSRISNLEEAKEKCYEACTILAEERLSAKFDWYDPDTHTSGDSIYDNAELFCKGTLPVAAVPVPVQEVFVLSECFVPEEKNNLVDDVEYMEIFKNDYPGGLDPVPFFASPKTYGIKYLEQLWGVGEYTFYFDHGGKSCLYQFGFDEDENVIDPYPVEDDDTYIYLKTDNRYSFETELSNDEYCTDYCEYQMNLEEGVRFKDKFFKGREISKNLGSGIKKHPGPTPNKLRSGTNTVHVTVENDEEDVCMEANGDLVIVGRGLDIYEPASREECINDFNGCWTGPDFPNERCITVGTQASKDGLPYCCVPADANSQNTNYQDVSHFVPMTCVEYEDCVQNAKTRYDMGQTKSADPAAIDDCIAEEEEEVCVVGSRTYRVGETIPVGSDNFKCCVEGDSDPVLGPCPCEVKGVNRMCLTAQDFLEHPLPLEENLLENYYCDIGKCYEVEVSRYETDCIDSDGGLNEFKSGSVKWEFNDVKKSISDECWTDTTLNEAQCSNDNVGYYTRISCGPPGSCQNGACTREPNLNEYTDCEEEYGESYWCGTIPDYQNQCNSQGIIEYPLGEPWVGCDTGSDEFGYCVKCNY